MNNAKTRKQLDNRAYYLKNRNRIRASRKKMREARGPEYLWGVATSRVRNMLASVGLNRLSTFEDLLGKNKQALF